MRLILIIITFVAGSTVQAQFLTQSAEGKGTLPLPLNGAGISVDIGKTEIAFGLNNYGKVISNARKKWFYGLNLAGKNSDGLGSLFNSGEIVPEGSLLGFTGFSFSNNTCLDVLYDSSVKKLIDSLKDYANYFTREYYPDSLRMAVGKLVFKKVKDVATRDSLLNDIQNNLSNLVKTDWEDYFKNYKPDCSKFQSPDECKGFLESLSKQIDGVAKHFGEEYGKLLDKHIKETESANIAFARKHHVMRFTGFLMGGISARSFKRYLGLSMPDFSKSFQDTLYRGGNFGIGLNFQFREIWLGITYAYNKTDNFSQLSSKDYTIRTVDTSGSTSFIQEKKVTAYPGKYARVEINELNIDLLFSIKMDATDTARILINPYLRANLFSRDTAFLKNTTNLGLGAYFLGKNRKFIGGLYVELPDVNNNREKAKPAEEQNIRSPFKKLSFGIITKFNISSFFNFTNRARKPD